MASLSSVNDADLLHELEPYAATFLDRHLTTAKEWFPHELVPWSRGRDFEADEQWDPLEYDIDEGVRSSLFVNMLTEDNLPHYFHTIKTKFGHLGAWVEWSHRWTAEEGRHLIVIRDYLTVTRAVDPKALERARVAQVSKGEVPNPDTVMESIIYVAIQELATRVAHRNTGKMLEDPAGEAIMKRVAMDENLHHIFYRDLASQALLMDPSGFMIALNKQVTDFEMPGTGIEGFKAHAAAIARAGIYDFALHYEHVLAPVVLRAFDIESVTGLSGEGEAARENVMTHITRLARFVERSKQRADRKARLDA
jgi:acyl-[acyl-carrier-protein] desaturase